MGSWTIIKNWMTRNINHESWETCNSKLRGSLFVLFNVQSSNFIVQRFISIDFFGKLIILFGKLNTMRTSGCEKLNENYFIFFNKWSKVGISQYFNMFKFDFATLFTSKIVMLSFINLSCKSFPWLF